MVSCSCCNTKVLIGILVVSVLLFVGSLVLAFKGFPDIIYFQLNNGVRLEKGSIQYDRFVDIPFPVDFKVYLFNVENPEEILTGATPKVKEVGPFVYKQRRHKNVLYTDTDEDVIAYTQDESFEFVNNDQLPEETNVTVLNPALMSIYQAAEESYLAGAADTCIKKTFSANHADLFITLPAKELLFQGYNFCENSGALEMCSLVNNLICDTASSKKNIDILPDSMLKFSYFNYKQKAPDGKYVVKRGIDDVSTLGHIITWNDMRRTDYWAKDSTCGDVKGSDSTIFPPRITTDDTFFIYTTDLCRFIEITYQKKVTYKDIEGYQFGTHNETLYTSQANVEDDCFCIKGTKDINHQDSCYLDGVVDLATCTGAPILLSFPHFLWADEKYLNGVEGLHPQKDLHNTYGVIEPNTGTVLKGAKRIQMNTVLRPIVGIKSLKQSAKAVLPLVWIEEGVNLPDKYVDELKSSYFNKVKLVEGFRWALIAVTGVLVVIFGGIVIRKRMLRK